MIFDLKQARVVIFKTISTADLRGNLGGREFFSASHPVILKVIIAS